MPKLKTSTWRIVAMVVCAVVFASAPQPFSVQVSAYVNEDEIDGGVAAGDSGYDDEDDYDDNYQDDVVDSGSTAAAVEQPAATTNPEDKYQGQINSINDKMKDLEAEKALIQSQINNTKDAKAKEQANKNYIDQQINITKDEIYLLEQRIVLLEESIVDKLQSIEDKQGEYDDNYQKFLKRLHSIQLNGEASVLGLVLGAEDFSDYLTMSEMAARVAARDREMMDNLRAEREVLEEEKSTLEQNKEMLEGDRDSMEEKRSLLAVQQQEAQLKIQDMEELERQFKADLAKNQALQAQMQAELDDIYRQIEWDKNPYVGGEMAWPLPGYYNITSSYGWRFGGADFHTGMDISGSGVHGKSIVAANAGTVKHVNWAYSAGRGYGIYLIVDHGGGTSTLYAHCSNIVVKEGDKVSKGQKIAEVGSTGWSTGPHLHFEVRINGAHTDPKPYVTA